MRNPDQFAQSIDCFWVHTVLAVRTWPGAQSSPEKKKSKLPPSVFTSRYPSQPAQHFNQNALGGTKICPFTGCTCRKATTSVRCPLIRFSVGNCASLWGAFCVCVIGGVRTFLPPACCMRTCSPPTSCAKNKTTSTTTQLANNLQFT